MRYSKKLSLIALAGLTACLAAACRPGAPVSFVDPTVTPTPAQALSPTPAPADLLEPTEQPPTPTGGPSGWSGYTSPDLGLAIFYPSGWEVSEAFAVITLEEPTGGGKLTVSPLQEEGIVGTAIGYKKGMSSAEALEAILNTIRTGPDGPSVDIGPVEAREFDLGSASAVEVYDREKGEGSYLVVIDFGESALLFAGMGADQESWRSELIPLYDQIIATARLAE
jgi:hypothetical protein